MLPECDRRADEAIADPTITYGEGDYADTITLECKMSTAEIINGFPDLTREDLTACIADVAGASQGKI